MIVRGMRERWEDATFARGGRVAIIGADDSVRYATCAEELEPTPLKKVPFTRAEWARIDRMFAEHDARARARRAA